MGLYYNSLIHKIKEDFKNQSEFDLFNFCMYFKQKYCQEFYNMDDHSMYYFNIHKILEEEGEEIPPFLEKVVENIWGGPDVLDNALKLVNHFNLKKKKK